MKTSLKPGDIVHYFSDNIDRWFDFLVLTQNEIDCIESGVDTYEEIPKEILQKYLQVSKNPRLRENETK